MQAEGRDELERRLEQLEQEARRWRLAGTLAVAALALAHVWLVEGFWRPLPLTAHEVRARRITLVDEAGRVRAVLGAEADGAPRLRLYDPAGRPLFTAP